MRTEVRPLGVEIVTVSMELTGAEASRPFIEAAEPEHPSLIDVHHQMGALFGVVNIPNIIWIDEDGMIVRPAEPGWAGETEYPAELQAAMIERAKQNAAEGKPNLLTRLGGGQERDGYADAIRDWAENGANSPFAMTPDEVVAASQPRNDDTSAAAAHFGLANHLWRADRRDAAIAHFNEAHRLQPDNWTYKRQAWSLVGSERVGGGVMGRFNQDPLPGEETDWPFAGSFNNDISELEPGEYYPKTL